MKNTFKIAVIGGTGKAGRYLVETLLEQGYHLRLLVRNPKNLKTKNHSFEVVYGDVRDYDTVQTVMEGCAAVLSTLGGSPMSEPTVFSKATKNILRAMSQHQIKRYILVAGLNVNTPFDKKGPKTQAGTDWMHANFPESTRDRQYEYDILGQSNVDWTLIRLPMIKQTDERFDTHCDLTDCKGDEISATDLAFFMEEHISKDDFIRQAPFLFNS